jgi:rubrerythrin
MPFKFWYRHFEANTNHFAHLDWKSEDKLTASEKKIIYSSIQQFQRGENSEGKHLFHAAKELNDPLYVETIRIFIREEQRHAMTLGRFMEKHDIPRIHEHWVDGVFRWLRKAAGLYQTLAILLTAEIIAKVYYRGLGAATKSELLHAICRQILKDEDMHLLFQCHALGQLYAKQSFLQKLLNKLFQYVLMAGTLPIVWIHHRKVLLAGKIGFFQFGVENIRILMHCSRLISLGEWPLALRMLNA